MPSFASIFNNNSSQKKHCCTCGCHVPTPINTAIAQEQLNISSGNSSSNSSIILSPTRWFPRIRRRSSSSSSASSIDSVTSYFSSNTFGNRNEELTTNTGSSADFTAEVDSEAKQLSELQAQYKLAMDEIAYAIESQGSIYYNGDLLTATEAVSDCLSRFQTILQSLKDTDRSFGFQQEWTDSLISLQSKLDKLPPADTP